MIGERPVSPFKTLAEVQAAARQIAEAEPEPRPLVLAEGNEHADLMIVGEGPGAEEEAQRRPFVGPAGRMLDRWLARVGINRRDVWVTNVVKTRKVVVAPGSRLKNRAPLMSEIRAWLPILEAEIALIRPRLLLCLGAPAAKVILGKDFRLTEQRGRWFAGPLRSRAIATFHPAYVLRLEGEDRDRVEELVRRDLAEVAEARLAIETAEEMPPLRELSGSGGGNIAERLDG